MVAYANRASGLQRADVGMPNKWLLPLDKTDRFDGFSAGVAGIVGAGVAPGDGLVLVDATGGIAWVVAVARAFRTRRTSEATVVYFDGICVLPDPLDAQPPPLGLPALDACGWADILTDCDFLLDYEIDEETWGNKQKPYRWPDEVDDEALGRLLDLNQKRHREERIVVSTHHERGESTPSNSAKRRSLDGQVDIEDLMGERSGA